MFPIEKNGILLLESMTLRYADVAEKLMIQRKESAFFILKKKTATGCCQLIGISSPYDY
jgi:hypothetical protein